MKYFFQNKNTFVIKIILCNVTWYIVNKGKIIVIIKYKMLKILWIEKSYNNKFQVAKRVLQTTRIFLIFK